MVQETDTGMPFALHADRDAELLDSRWIIGTVDFTVDPPSATNATIIVNQGQYAGGWVRMWSGQVAFTFPLPATKLSSALELTIVGQVLRSSSAPRFAPVTLTVNGVVCGSDFTFPGDGLIPQKLTFSVPPAALQTSNTVRLAVEEGFIQTLALYSLGVQYAYDVAAPDMTTVAHISAAGYWDLGSPPVDLGGGSPFTVEAWISPQDAGANTSVLKLPGVFDFALVNGILTAAWVDGAEVSGVTALRPGIWHHVAVTSGSVNESVTLYICGVPDGSRPVQRTVTSPSAGCRVGSGADDTGLDVWSVALYSVARPADDEAVAPWQDVTPVAGLVATYDFSVAPPRAFPDSVKLTPQQGAVSQTVAPAVRFDGQTTGIVVTDLASFATNPEYTISAWVTFDEGSEQNPVIFACGDISGDATVALGAHTGGYLWAKHGTVSTGARLDMTPGNWHNVGVVCRNWTITLHIDGIEVGTPASVTPLGPDASAVGTAGMAIADGQKVLRFTGSIQWLSAFSRALSPDEMRRQAYQEVGSDPAILLDLPMDSLPLVDTGTEHAVSLDGNTGVTIQRDTVTNWTPPPEQLDPGCWQTPTTRRTLNSTCSDTVATAQDIPAFSEEHITAAVAAVEPFLAGAPESIAAPLRARVEHATRSAFKAARQDPSAFAPIAAWYRRDDDDVFIHHHPDGDIELLRVPAGSVSQCVIWKTSFLFAVAWGLPSLYGLTPDSNDVFTFVNERLLGDPRVMEALSIVLIGAFNAHKLLELLGKLNEFGLLKILFWRAVDTAGWMALTRVLIFIGGMFTGLAAAQFAASAAVLVTQLALKVAGSATLGVTGYFEACGGVHRAEAAPNLDDSRVAPAESARLF